MAGHSDDASLTSASQMWRLALQQHRTKFPVTIGRASLARENEAGGSWGQEVHILHVNI